MVRSAAVMSVVTMLLVALPLSQQARAASDGAVIAEVFNGGSASDEWVTLANVDDQPLDLTGWQVRDHSAAGDPQAGWTFPAGSRLAPRSLLVIERSAGNSGAAEQGVDAITGGSFNVAAGSDRLDLLDAQGQLVDGVAWGSANSVEGFRIADPDLASGQSLERVALADADTAEDWAVDVTPEAWAWAPMVAEEPVPVGDAEVHFIDVGQADGIYVELPGDIDVVVDCGRWTAPDVVHDYLVEQGVDDIELLIATHPDADHIGGCDRVLEGFEVEQVVDNGQTHTTQTFARYRAARDAEVAAGADYQVPDFQTFAWGSIVLEVIGPVRTRASDFNNSSVMARLDVGEVGFMLTGDAEFTEENEVMARAAAEGIDLTAEFLKVGHHGSAGSTSAAFLDAVQASWGIISVGASNSYGHPTAATLGRLADAGVETYRTDQSGDVVVATDGESASVDGVTVLDPTGPPAAEVTSLAFDPAPPAWVEDGGVTELSVAATLTEGTVVPAYDEVTFASSDQAVVAVDGTTATGVGRGAATLTATSTADPRVTSTAAVEVVEGSQQLADAVAATPVDHPLGSGLAGVTLDLPSIDAVSGRRYEVLRNDTGAVVHQGGGGPVTVEGLDDAAGYGFTVAVAAADGSPLAMTAIDVATPDRTAPVIDRVTVTEGAVEVAASDNADLGAAPYMFAAVTDGVADPAAMPQAEASASFPAGTEVEVTVVDAAGNAVAERVRLAGGGEPAWTATVTDGTSTFTVDADGGQVRFVSDGIDTGVVPDPDMRVSAGSIRGDVTTEDVVVRYMLPQRGRARAHVSVVDLDSGERIRVLAAAQP